MNLSRIFANFSQLRKITPLFTLRADLLPIFPGNVLTIFETFQTLFSVLLPPPPTPLFIFYRRLWQYSQFFYQWKAMKINMPHLLQEFRFRGGPKICSFQSSISGHVSKRFSFRSNLFTAKSSVCGRICAQLQHSFCTSSRPHIQICNKMFKDSGYWNRMCIKRRKNR